MDANLEATCDALYKMACDVNDALYYQYHASMEEQYQSAYSYELKKKKYVFHSETVIQLLYKEFPLRETEADYLGLMFSSLSGYDIRESVKLWERMSQKNKGKEPPVFLSTHPSSKKRI